MKKWNYYSADPKDIECQERPHYKVESISYLLLDRISSSILLLGDFN